MQKNELAPYILRDVNTMKPVRNADGAYICITLNSPIERLIALKGWVDKALEIRNADGATDKGKE